jgi:DNA-binding transcriptional regulator YiaG
MNSNDFVRIRRFLGGRTQAQLAQLLGVSPKAIQSFEQGWRNIPVHIERHLLFLLFQKGPSGGRKRVCWVIRKCPIETKRNCPAWEFKLGHLCWFINGTICHGEVQQNWQKKMRLCRQCEVFELLLPLV